MKFNEGIATQALRCNFYLEPNSVIEWVVLHKLHKLKSTLKTQKLQLDLHRKLEADIYNDYQRDRRPTPFRERF